VSSIYIYQLSLPEALSPRNLLIKLAFLHEDFSDKFLYSNLGLVATQEIAVNFSDNCGH
jgi:hypothetical protein